MHNDSKITSLEGFFRIIKKFFADKDLSVFYHEVADMQMIYRGHSDIDWSLIPSAFRNSKHIKNERLYLKEFLRQLPNETENLDYFDVLVKAQHYGIPTRLLDFTLNPLIALYFACSSNEDRDGMVICILNQGLFSQQDLSIKVLMHYIFRFKHGYSWSDKNTELLQQSLSKDPSVFEEINSEEINKILSSDRPIFVSPKLKNNRIQVQNGLFALFNTPLQKNNQSYNLKFELLDTYNICEPNKHKQIIVSKESKASIRRELDSIGINEAYLFPGLETGLKTIVQRIDGTNNM
ncbi:MAG: FRG domain-containing protein [Eubacteriales bacterium]